MVYAPVRSIIPSLSSGIISPYRRTHHALSLTCITIEWLQFHLYSRCQYTFTFVFRRPKMKIVYIVPSEDRLQKLKDRYCATEAQTNMTKDIIAIIRLLPKTL